MEPVLPYENDSENDGNDSDDGNDNNDSDDGNDNGDKDTPPTTGSVIAKTAPTVDELGIRSERCQKSYNNLLKQNGIVTTDNMRVIMLCELEEHGVPEPEQNASMATWWSKIGHYFNQGVGAVAGAAGAIANAPFNILVPNVKAAIDYGGKVATTAIVNGLNAAKGVGGAAVGGFIGNKFFGATIYLFLVIHIIISIFSTFGETVGIDTSVSTRLIVIILSLVQLLWAYIAIQTGFSSVSIYYTIGAVYFLVLFVGGLICSIIQGLRMRNKESQAFNIIALIIKSAQALFALIFGLMFFFRRDQGYSALGMYMVMTLTVLEVISQILSFTGLNG